MENNSVYCRIELVYCILEHINASLVSRRDFDVFAQAIPEVSELRRLVQEPQEGDDAEAGRSSSGGAV